jgi:DNA-binding transcriptional LysR family regulator
VSVLLLPLVMTLAAEAAGMVAATGMARDRGCGSGLGLIPVLFELIALARLIGTGMPCDLTQHTVVTIEGVAGGVLKRQPRSPAQRFLSVTTIEAAIEAVRSGLCFGWLPIYRIQPYLDSGELLPLRMPVGGTREVRLNIIHSDLSPGNRELGTLAELLGINRNLELI